MATNNLPECYGKCWEYDKCWTCDYLDQCEEKAEHIIVAQCSCCGEETEYELSDEELDTYKRYFVYGRQIGYIQDLFPNVPAWIRSGAIDIYSDGFCVCPKCCGMEE